MATDTTGNIVKAAIARILAFSDDAGRDVGDYVGTGSSARIYVSQADDDATYPYIVLRKVNTTSNPDYSVAREEFDIEASIFGRPRHAKEQETELIADLVEMALLTWHESSEAVGLVFGQTSLRNTDPPDVQEVDRDIVQITMAVRCAGWPRYRTNALT